MPITAKNFRLMDVTLVRIQLS